ncbi:MAG: hypothetical protein ACLP5E_28180 [Streptosporangiaceae bacterium]
MDPVVVGPAAHRLPGAYLASAAGAPAAGGLRFMPGELRPRVAGRGIPAVRWASTG